MIGVALKIGRLNEYYPILFGHNEGSDPDCY